MIHVKVHVLVNTNNCLPESEIAVSDDFEGEKSLACDLSSTYHSSSGVGIEKLQWALQFVVRKSCLLLVVVEVGGYLLTPLQ